MDDRSTAGRETGQLPVSSFVSDNFTKDGTWLGIPQAVRKPPTASVWESLLGMHLAYQKAQAMPVAVTF